MRKKSYINVEIERLTNSIVNVISGDILETEFHRVTKKEIRKKDWLFDWGYELADKKNQVYKMTIKGSNNIIQGLISMSFENDFIFVNLIESAQFNRGKEKLYEGVGGNMFAFACKVSKDSGFGGFVSFVSKASLMEYYTKTLGAQRAVGQRMVILDSEADKLIMQYFKK